MEVFLLKWLHLYKTGWAVQACFAIGLHHKDRALLERIQYSLGGVGRIGKEGNNKNYSIIHYEVKSIKELTKVIIPHFDKYPLLSKKRADFELFKQVVALMDKKEHLTPEGLQKIVNIKASMNLGLSDSLANAYPNTHPVTRPVVDHVPSIDLNWFAGFTSAEGCFFVEIFKHTTKIGYGVRLKFQVTQNNRDLELLSKFSEQLGCGRCETVKGRKLVNFVVTRVSDIELKILPLFIDYPIYGMKALDLADFRKVLEIMKGGGHLTLEGLEEIRKIKERMRVNG